jgi:hypothetical protein
MDVATRQLVDHQPRQPTPDHEWNAETKRCQLTAAEQTRLTNRADALAKIASLEASGIRAGREAQLGMAAAVVDGLLTKFTQAAGAAEQKTAGRPLSEPMPDSPAA